MLAETGKATEDRPALPHTVKTFHADESDVAEIQRLREEGIRNFSDDIVGPSREAALKAGYEDHAVDRAWVDQLGNLHASQRLADTVSEAKHWQAQEHGGELPEESSPTDDELASFDDPDLPSD